MDDDHRDLVSEDLAQGFLMDVLLSIAIGQMPDEHMQPFCEQLAAMYEKNVPNIVLPGADAEVLADLKVRATKRLREHLDRALRGARDGRKMFAERDLQ